MLRDKVGGKENRRENVTMGTEDEERKLQIGGVWKHSEGMGLPLAVGTPGGLSQKSLWTLRTYSHSSMSQLCENLFLLNSCSSSLQHCSPLSHLLFLPFLSQRRQH